MSTLDDLQKMKTLTFICITLCILLTSCSKPAPTAQDITKQIQAITDRNNGEGYVKIFDVVINDFYQKDDAYYVIIDFKGEYLVSKTEYIERLKSEVSGTAQGMLNSMMTQMIEARLSDFKKGDIEESKGQHIRILKSQNGWIIDTQN
ncbi:Unannotated [Lentimonas sp. CC4]|nr:Unannotated [Lentimonas sp. CC4]CAA6686980.1 Unannotated [Lentimonas sp. CC6]CAA7077657.1 Unannotated [Lentimonas sp. CC4]CAA7168467.1 Unannotated [Lentimonas sp. CC21]CAA7182970.1 Unannotated [Lentimonas sp. CC8]